MTSPKGAATLSATSLSTQEHKDSGGAPAEGERINLNVTDWNDEAFFKIKRTTKLDKLMKVFCDRQGKDPFKVRFLFDGWKVLQGDTPEKLGMRDGDIIEVMRVYA
ncbi:Ubiquitin-like protein SMT3 [Cyphellophora attinorum]|uniref:Ubiquitin-like protein SMT3 n=1 Tax=Cyphellophora attinorum TaxID=1664694 RepID=A0A0N1H4U7_9EURO|nr:Ubiquitin-like protein SMT3 [Phialophora attinorum]KPI40493.1 Ubiquitin-like protein SMT3 [Phialophora attinorum]